MRFYSPLRYPGGKNKLAKFVSEICTLNNINGHYIEPYAGGASVALYLLMNGYVREITINDFDRSIYAFWYSIVNHTEKFCNKIANTEVTVANWKKYKNIHSNKKSSKLFDLGFATFFLNRTNRSGIINGGIMGGLDQKGKYKIDCRFNKQDLIERIRVIAGYKKNINLYNLDALQLIKEVKEKSVKNTIFYFDPPYYLKGPSLYMNHYKHKDHKEVSEMIMEITNAGWIVTYDNVEPIRELYKKVQSKRYTLTHSAHSIKKGKEIMFHSLGLVIPKVFS